MTPMQVLKDLLRRALPHLGPDRITFPAKEAQLIAEIEAVLAEGSEDGGSQ